MAHATTRPVDTMTSPTWVEVRSIDYVPVGERHGKAWHLAPVWFVGNAELVSFATGAIGVALGLNFAWTAVAIVLGSGIGALMMAFHSTQGPRLGLSQMIQSRPQFGYYGSLLPIAAGLFIFIGFDVFDSVLGGQLLNSTIKTPVKLSYVIFVLLALGVTALGYKLIHRFAQWASFLYLANFGLLTVIALAKLHLPSSQYSLSGTFQVSPFIIMLGILVSYNLTWAPYVSDYSRYLPRDVSSRSVFWWTYLGTEVGAVWPAVMGAFVAAAYPKLTTIDSVRTVGDQLAHGWGLWGLLLLAPTLIGTTALGLYTAGLSTLAAIDVVRPVKSGIRPRVAVVTAAALVTLLVTLTIPENFLGKYYAFLTLILYFMIPWTAINLVDFFLVRKGRYAIKDIFSPRGMYGRWGWRGLAAYWIAFAAMIPFFSVPSLYTGPVANAIGGGDISPFIGFPVAAILYYLFCRNLDVQAEWEVADRQLREVDASAADQAPGMTVAP